MTCHLCQQDRQLCRSHIIPEFVYAPMYDKKHRYFVISGEPSTPVHRKQKGIREPLLCKPCENQLSRHENYVRRLLYGGASFYGKTKENRYNLSGLSYEHIRLCYLSILWRMSITSLPMFLDVSLGPHEERLRQMILVDDPGDPCQYGFIGVVPFIDGQVFPDFILQPECIKHDGHRIYRAVIGGILFMFLVSSHQVDAEVQRAFIQPEGTWVLIGEDVRRIEFLANWLSTAGKNNG
jgi:hypothetical protein